MGEIAACQSMKSGPAVSSEAFSYQGVAGRGSFFQNEGNISYD